MPRSDWRSPAAYAYVSDLEPSGLAWEFLRRNPEYRREYRAVSGESQSNDQAEAFACRWGMRFCVAPDIPANKAALIWLPQINPASVLIAPAPGAFAGARRVDPSSAAYERAADDGRYLLIDDGRSRIPVVLLAGSTRKTPAAALVPLDDDFAVRLEAALRLWQCLSGLGGTESKRPTPQRRERLTFTLRALDARLANERYRAIALGLFGEARVPSAAHWKTHDLRARTIRLVRSGLDLMRGGYIRLLSGRHRRR